MLETIYFARHGHRMDWISPIFDEVTYPTNLPWDSRLSQHGCNQAQELSQYFVKNNIKIDRIYSSPLFRTLQTASIIADKLDLEVFIEYGLSEWYDPLEAKTYPNCAPLSVLREFFPRINPAYIPITKLPNDGETLQGLQKRLDRTMQSLVDAGEDLKCVLIIAHAASLVAGVKALIKQRGAVINCGTCSLTKCTRSKEGWVLELNGDTSSLSHGSENNCIFTEVAVEDGVNEDEMQINNY
ncbi:histidine phosphatase superfamily [Gigaspora rosea]|uniref:Histidine phosphatase superfamily n=1 Tax=Gigaspora rosea TaxID=44941 RepID=A0A397TYD6_9GLOM|nr:histidine phosphatase superfamily [Gigaspora rosea]